MILVGKIERLQSKTNTYSKLFVTQGDREGQTIKFKAVPRFFKNVKRGVFVRVLGEYNDKGYFIVNKPIHIMRDFTADDIRVLAQHDLGVSADDIRHVFDAAGVASFRELLLLLESEGIETINRVASLTKGREIVRYLNRISYTQDLLALAEMLAGIGLDLPVAMKAMDMFKYRAARRYGKESNTQVTDYLRDEPYALAQVDGVRWVDADEMARQFGFSGGLNPKRIAGAVYSVLWNKARQGHVFYPRVDVVYLAWRRLGGNVGNSKKERQLINDVISEMINDHRLCFEYYPYGHCVQMMLEKEYPELKPDIIASKQGVLYLPAVYWSERDLAAKLGECVLVPPSVRIDTDKLVDAAQKIAIETLGEPLNAEQEKAVRNAANYSVSVLMGAAGTGKTTVINIIIQAIQKIAPEIEIQSPLAPTGRAAQLLGENAGLKGSTIHRYLRITPADDDYIEGGVRNDISEDGHPSITIIDETSMATVIILRRLMEKIRPGDRLIIAGDPNQLEAIGPGSVLRDLLEGEFPDDGAKGLSPYVPITILSRAYRQKGGDPVLDNAWKILKADKNTPADLTQVPGKFDFVEAVTEKEIAVAVQNTVKKVLESGISFEDVLVLVPRHDGPAGTVKLNTQIRQIINPDGKSLPETSLRLGDHVIAIQNDYKESEVKLRNSVFNGTRGIVESCLDTTGVTIGVKFNDREEIAYYHPEEIDRYLALAYALTVHKAQGSQARVVILACSSEGDKEDLINKPLLYTAVTRCKNGNVYLVGTRDTWEKAAARRASTRYGKFAWRLRDALGVEPELAKWEKIESEMPGFELGFDLDKDVIMPDDTGFPEPLQMETL